MRWCRIRLVLLGLTLCVVHVVSGLCGQNKTELANSVKKSDIVIEAKLNGWTEDKGAENTFYLNMTVKKEPYKGMKAIPNFRNRNPLVLRIFTGAQLKTCVQNINTKVKGTYFFFLKNDRNQSGLFKLHSAPVKKTKSAHEVVTGNLKLPQIPPTIVSIPEVSVVKLNTKFKLDCKAEGQPSPTVTWFKDGSSVTATKGRVKVKTAKRSPSQTAVTKTLKISRLMQKDLGQYSCLASNSAGNHTQHVTLKVTDAASNVLNDNTGTNKTTDSSTASNSTNNWTTLCASEGWCLNGGRCEFLHKIGEKFCKCPKEFDGQRCELRQYRFLEVDGQAILEYQRTLITIGIVIAVLVFITICIASYILSKRHIKRRRKAAASSVIASPRGEPVFNEPKEKRVESFPRRDHINSSNNEINSKTELDQPKNSTMVQFPAVKRNGTYTGHRQRLAANSYYDNNPDPPENIEMKSLGESNKTETVLENRTALRPSPDMSCIVPLTLSPPLNSSPPEGVPEIVGKHNHLPNHLPICESKSDRDLTRLGKQLSEQSPLLNEIKMRQSQTCPKMNSPIRDKLLVESSDSDDEMGIPYKVHNSLHISEEDLFPSKENLDSSSGSGDLSPARLARREEKVLGLLPSSNTARPAMRKYQSEEGPTSSTHTNRIHNLHLQDSIRSHSLDEPSALEMGIHPPHLNSTLPGSPEGEHRKILSPSQSHHNHNSYDPNDDDVPWDGNKTRNFSQPCEEERYKLKDVLPNQQPIPI